MAVRTRVRFAPSLLRLALLLPLAAGLAFGNSLAQPAVAAAAGPKVVIVVGPTHSATSTYITRAKEIAAQARSLGASVTEIYTPRATWARVVAAAQGAKMFVYLGHGTGVPGPYGTDPLKRNGLGLNPVDGVGTTSPVTYYGERLVAQQIRFAPGAVVLLNHLCYASGSSEPGMAEPSWDVARQRVDNYAAGFISAGAGAVIATAYRDVSYDVRAILTGRNMLSAWRANPFYKDHERSFASVRRPGFTDYLDPDNPSSTFYRSLVTKPGFVSGAGTAPAPAPVAKPAPLVGTTAVSAILRAKPSETAAKVTTLPQGARVAVIGQPALDTKGRTWMPVRTSTGKTGFVASWLMGYRGTVVTTDNVVLRFTPSTSGRKLEVVPAGTRLTVTGSGRDAQFRTWFAVRTPAGHTGWVASWYTKP